MPNSNEVPRLRSGEVGYTDPQAPIYNQFPEYGQTASEPEVIELLQEAVDNPLIVTTPSVPVVRGMNSDVKTDLPPAA